MGKGRRDKVILNTEQRQKLEAISRNGYAPAKKILHAQVLLMCDEGEGAIKKWTDEEISAALNLHRNTVGRIRKRFLEQGEEPPSIVVNEKALQCQQKLMVILKRKLSHCVVHNRQ